MFRLPQQIGCDQFSVHGVVGDDHGLGRPGEQVDADATIKLPLGFGDIGIARPHQHIDRGDGFGADGHGTDGLDAAQNINLMRPAQMHRRNDGGVGTPAERWRAGDDARHTRNGRGGDRHMRAGNHWKLTAGNIASDGLNGDVAMAEDNAWHRLDLDILQRVALCLREVANLFLRKSDVGELALRQFTHEVFDLVQRQAKALWRIAIEHRGQIAYRSVAPTFDIRKNLFDFGADLGVVCSAVGGGFRCLEMLCHGSLRSRTSGVYVTSRKSEAVFAYACNAAFQRPSFQRVIAVIAYGMPDWPRMSPAMT